jgi:hypothetical protein
MVNGEKVTGGSRARGRRMENDGGEGGLHEGFEEGHDGDAS